MKRTGRELGEGRGGRGNDHGHLAVSLLPVSLQAPRRYFPKARIIAFLMSEKSEYELERDRKKEEMKRHLAALGLHQLKAKIARPPSQIFF